MRVCFPPVRPFACRLPLRRLLLCALAALLAGCSMRIAYSHLDWLLPWYVGDYVTLERDQRRLLDARLADRLAWHCRHQLGPYVDLLRGLESDLRRGSVSAAELDRHLARGEALWQTLMEAIVPDARELLAVLDDRQVEELAAAFARRNREAREDFLDGTPEERNARRAERMEKRLRTWFGGLEPAQRRLVAQWSETLQPDTEQWLTNRERWQAGLLAGLERRAEPAALEAALRPLLTAADRDWPADYRRRLAANRMRTLELVAAIHAAATPRQREHLFGEIDAWVRQFERRSCASPAAAGAA